MCDLDGAEEAFENTTPCLICFFRGHSFLLGVCCCFFSGCSKHYYDRSVHVISSVHLCVFCYYYCGVSLLCAYHRAATSSAAAYVVLVASFLVCRLPACLVKKQYSCFIRLLLRVLSNPNIKCRFSQATSLGEISVSNCGSGSQSTFET